MSDPVAVGCPSCGAPLAPGDRFCERCGVRAGVDRDRIVDRGGGGGGDGGVGRGRGWSTRGRCRACACPDAIDADGYCRVCGARERRPGERVELDLAAAAAVTDQGRVHRRNEDAFHLQLGGGGDGRGLAAVVCDGISSAQAGDVAARSAARAAGALLAAAIDEPSLDATAATVAAIRAANQAVERVPWSPEAALAAPSCTLVCALWRGGELVVGSVGDSRAYWLDADGCSQLTVDDSWAQEQLEEGRLSAEEIADDRRFHSITHWVGADAPTRPPRVAVLRPAESGRLVLCTDGLWNYAPTAAELAGLVEALAPGAAPAAVARSLTETALGRGGRDNITVAVADIDPARPAARSGP